MTARETLDRMTKVGHDAWVTSSHFKEEEGFQWAIQAALKEFAEITGWWRSGSGMIAGTHWTAEETVAHILAITELEL